VVSSKGQVAILKPLREKLGLKPGTTLKVRVEGNRTILEPLEEPPREVFAQAGPRGHRTHPERSSGKVASLLKEI